jgi:hypothetical protein
MNLRAEDEFVDVFPGTGAVQAAWQKWIGSTAVPSFELTCTAHEQPVANDRAPHTECANQK